MGQIVIDISQPYYFKAIENGLPVVSQNEDDAKQFEYKEDAEIVSVLLNLHIQSRYITLPTIEYVAVPAFEGANHMFILKEQNINIS